jgi:methanol--5-hydroxybenzimidazolylcobamide Co-methyltransferase
MNTASSHGSPAARTLRDWWVESDAAFDPQAYVLRPDVVLRLAGELVQESTPYRRARRAALATLAELRRAVEAGQVQTNKLEQRWLERLSRQADGLPEEEEALVASLKPDLDENKVRLEEYGL